MSDPVKIKRLETFLYILIVIQLLTLVGMFLIVQNINKSVIEIKKFCWGNRVGGVPTNEEPYLDIIH